MDKINIGSKSLDRQINMYSVDTGHFYSNHEKYLHDMNCKYRQERNYVNNKLKDIIKKLLSNGITENDLKALNKSEDKFETLENLLDDLGTKDSKLIELLNDYLLCQQLIVHKRQKAKESKNKLLKLLSNKMEQNILTNGRHHIRTLRENELHDNNVISVFESFLSRTIGIQQDEFTNDLLVMQVYYFDVFKDTCFYGFMYKGEKYRYYTSSAGQIRKKKAVFIKESTWDRINKTIMCGLTIDMVNIKGGNNVNKHLAYLALSNSATEEWSDFDIDRSIVIDDFETNVFGTYDLINDEDYSITRKNDYVPIPHTDGAGMILPQVSDKNFMIRLPWVKGLLGVFPYDKFILEKNYSPIIKDIYGKEHNLFEENIQVIFTKSQFKMWKYYESWDQYKEYFKKYNCKAGVCNMEEDRIKNSKINYQMLQTLTDITDDEIDVLTKQSLNKIKNVCRDKKTMMNILGITPYNNNLTPFQESVKIYPALLSDTYSKDVIREVKNSLLKKYRSGKLEVSGKYTFVLPDFYASCDYWFGHIENPVGLLNDQEVYCELFKHSNKLDCLRSPHLYKEHAVRTNVAFKDNIERRKEISQWFLTNGIYTSTHDLITKILQLDRP